MLKKDISHRGDRGRSSENSNPKPVIRIRDLLNLGHAMHKTGDNNPTDFFKNFNHPQSIIYYNFRTIFFNRLKRIPLHRSELAFFVATF